MTKIIDMNNPESVSELKTEVNAVSDEKKFDIKSIGNPESPSRFEITDTKTDKVYSINADALAGGDYHQIIRAADETISEDDIRSYQGNLLPTVTKNKGKNIAFSEYGAGGPKFRFEDFKKFYLKYFLSEDKFKIKSPEEKRA